MLQPAALVSNLCLNALDPQSIGVIPGLSSKYNARCESSCGTSSQSDSEDLPDNHKHPQNVPVHHMEIFFHLAAEPDRQGNCLFEAMYRQNLQADQSGENG